MIRNNRAVIVLYPMEIDYQSELFKLEQQKYSVSILQIVSVNNYLFLLSTCKLFSIDTPFFEKRKSNSTTEHHIYLYSFGEQSEVKIARLLHIRIT